MMHQDIYTHIDPHPCPPNHVFDHRPGLPPPPPANPKTWAFNGQWQSYRPYIETNTYSNAAPGIHSGLYNPVGPLNLGDARFSPTYLINVTTECEFSLAVTFNYSKEDCNKTISLTVGNIYNVTYIEDGDIKKCVGKCSDIWKILGSDNATYYKIKFDCSTSYSNSVVIIKNDQIRDLSLYTGYEDTDTTLCSNTIHKYGTTVGTIKDVIITNATIDANGQLIEGDVIQGSIDGYTMDGVARGENATKDKLTVINGKTANGTIINGKILSGLFKSGSIDGKTEPDTNITVRATIKGVIAHAVIVNTTVEGGTTTNGTIIDANSMEDAILYNGVITGDDMITTGGITAGNITTGGTTTGGSSTGGTMVGLIDGKVYTIEGGQTTSKDGKKLITSGGVVTGGTIIGGVQNGNTIIGAVIKGGVCTNGITVNGKNTGGEIIPTPTSPVPITRTVIQDPKYLDLNPDMQPKNLFNPTPCSTKFDTDDLIVGIDAENSQVIGTNFGKVQMNSGISQIHNLDP